MKSNSKNFERVDNRGGQLENCFHQRERERERGNCRPCPKYIVAMLKFRLQLSSSSPLPENCTPNSSQFPYTNFHPYLSCLYRGYLFVHVSPHSNHGTNRSTTKTPPFPEMIDFSKGQLVSTRHQSSGICIPSHPMRMTKVNLHFFSLFYFISRTIRSLNSIHFASISIIF